MSEGHDSSTDEPTPRPQPPQEPWAAPGGATPPQQGPAPGGGPYHGAPQAPPPGGYGPAGGYPGGPGGGYGNPPGAGYGRAYGAPSPPPEMRPGIIPLRPLGVGEILDGALRLIRSSPRATLGLAAVVAAIGILPSSIAQAIEMNETLDEVLSGGGAPASATFVPSVAELIGSGLSLVAQFFLVTILTGIFTRILGRAVFGGRITAAEAWQRTKGQVPTLLLLALVTTLIMAAPAVLLIVLLVAAIAAEAYALVLLLSLGGLVGLLCYVAFFGVRLALAAPAVVLERLGVTDALRRSWRLTSGSFWRVLGVILLTNLIVFLIMLVVGVPFALVAAVIAFAAQGASGAVAAGAVLGVLAEMCAAIIGYPLQAGVYGLLYTDRRMRTEAFDLVLQSAAADQYRLGWVPATADDLWLPPSPTGPHGGA